MDRATWLADRKAALIATYDDEAPTYDANPYPVPLHAAWVDRLVATVPPGGLILDAPCGTGRWFSRVVDAGRRVVGVDQSPGMLAQAAAKGLAEWTELGRLETLALDRDVDAAMTIDALENVTPEQWPVVAANLHRVVRAGGHVYLTLEELDGAAIEDAYRDGLGRGWPLVRGEVIEGDTAGYHYYPGRERALGWLTDAGFEALDDAFDQQDGWGYRHVLLRRP
jgi:ubiquinone/menaquinone biosynthesis C-methylase UbiE